MMSIGSIFLVLQFARQPLSGMRFCRFCHGFRRAGHNYLSATAAAFRAEIDDPVCNLDDIHIMFNAKHRAAGVNELAEGREQLTDVVKVEAGGGLVENI